MPNPFGQTDFRVLPQQSGIELPTAHIPSHKDASVEVFAVRSQGAVALVIDEAACAAGPLVRGSGPPYRARHGRRITEPREMRADLQGVVGPAGHLERWSKDHPRSRAHAVTGCGNLGMNSGVLAWKSGRSETLGAAGTYEHRLLSVGNGRGVMQSRAEAVNQVVIRGSDGWAVSGPTLVLNAEVALSSAECFADPRHVLLFPYLEVAPGVWADFGCDAMLRDPMLYGAAVAGEVVRLPMREWLPSSEMVDCPLVPHDVSVATLAKALQTKGYKPAAKPSGRGSYAMDEHQLLISFLPGIYPHHVLALEGDGRLCSILVTGLSNRCGVTLPGLAKWLVAVGFREALLLDNGGDVGLYDARSEHFVVRPAEPDRRETWPITACLVYAQE